MNKELIQKTEEFLKTSLRNNPYYDAKPSDGEYRLEHSYRVANIGKQIAEQEGFDVTETVIACLLHDVSYGIKFTEGNWANHGRDSARIARPFLKDLGLPDDRINDICYGIAIHVDDKADFEGERTAFAETVGDADNLDRFDAYRIYETLQYCNFKEMSLDEKKEKVASTLQNLNNLKGNKLGTAAATALWKERIAYYISFYEKLQAQLENSTSIQD